MPRQSAPRHRGYPLALIIALPSASLGALFAAVLLVVGSSALSRAVEDEAKLFAGEFGKRLAAYLADFFHSPLLAGRATVDRIVSGGLDPADKKSLQAELIPKIHDYRWLSSIGVARADGSYVAATRSPENEALIYVDSGPQTDFRQHRREIDRREGAGRLLALGGPYDPRESPWFAQASSGKGALWSVPYTLTLFGVPGIAVSTPVFDASGKLTAVVHGELALVQISRFLQATLPEASALAFVLDERGDLLASSSAVSIAAGGKEGNPDLSADPLLHEAVVASRDSGNPDIHLGATGGVWHLLRYPFVSIEGLPLQIGIVVEVAKLSGPLDNFRRMATGILLFATLVLGLGGWYIAKAVSFQVGQLNERAAGLAAGEWSASTGKPPISNEIRQLSASFDTMATTLRGNLESLESTVAQRTQALETLLREVNHRIKNTLNVAASLLSLQGSLTESAETREALDAAALRIMSMSLLYSRLHLSADRERVELRSYVNAVVDALEGGSIGPRPIRVERRIDSVTVSAKVASSVGIIVTEFFTNACKYAFPAGRAGVVRVLVSRTEAGLRIEIDDDGIGFPEGFDPAASGGFGLSVADEMAQTMGGSLSFVRLDPGSGVILEIATPAAG